MGHNVFSSVNKLEKHGIRDVESSQLVERAGRHDHFAAMVYVLAFGPREHSNRVAAVVFVEAAGRSCSTSSHHA